jgi:M6 family metalloprotease-like protein
MPSARKLLLALFLNMLAASLFQVTPVAAASGGVTGSTQLLVAGPMNLLVIAVDFPDCPHTLSIDNITKNTIGELNAYYAAVSYGVVSVTGKVVGWIRMPSKLTTYGADNGPFVDAGSTGGMMPSTWMLLRDAAPKLAVQMADYDKVFVLHAGLGQESSGQASDIWSVTYLDFPLETKHDSIRVFAVVPEFEARDFKTVGVYAHEFGHLLGLPDLYDTASEKVGPWDLMARGAWNGNPLGSTPAELTAWSRLELGWLNSQFVCEMDTEMPTQETIDLRPIELPPVPGQCSAALVHVSAQHYYLVEVRIHTGYDTALPEEGVLISKVLKDKISIVSAQPKGKALINAAWQPGSLFHQTIQLNLPEATDSGRSTTQNTKQQKADMYLAVTTRTGNTYTVTVSFQGPPLIFTTPLSAAQNSTRS